MAHPIPAGHHAITPHLVIDGASEAIEFYKKAFGAEEIYRMPFPGPDGRVRIGHARSPKSPWSSVITSWCAAR